MARRLKTALVRCYGSVVNANWFGNSRRSSNRYAGCSYAALSVNIDAHYTRTLDRLPTMPAAAQAELAARYARTRDRRDADRLVLGNLRLVVKLAREIGAWQVEQTEYAPLPAAASAAYAATSVSAQTIESKRTVDRINRSNKIDGMLLPDSSPLQLVGEVRENETPLALLPAPEKTQSRHHSLCAAFATPTIGLFTVSTRIQFS